MKEIFKKKEDLVFNILDFFIIICLILLSIKKGGFYKTDTLLFNFITCFIGAIYVIFKLILKKIKFQKIDIGFIFLIALSLCYTLSIIFKNYSSLNDAVFEFIRYFNIISIYLIVKNSKSKKIYINGLIVLGGIACLFGIDSIASRYMLDILRKFNTGYLSTNLDRMSGTIEYANTFGVLIASLSLILIKKLDKLKENIFKFTFLNIIFYMFVSCILLTGSRYLMLVYIIFLIILICKNIKNKLFISINLCTNILLAFLINACAVDLFGDNKFYILYAIFLLLSFFVTLLVLVIANKVLKNKVSKKVVLITLVCSALVILLYVCINFAFYKPIYLNEKNNLYEAYIYLNNNKVESININVDNKNSNDYSLEARVYEVASNDTSTLINTYKLSNDNLKIEDLKLTDSFKCLKIDLVLKKGNVKIENISVNGKDCALSYYLIPYKFVIRTLDSIYGSNSTSLRYTYIKDALKISTSNVKNFLFGCGGEAFKNMYNSVKEIKYVSTETHSSFIQILIESGIFGFISIISLIIYVLIKGKNSEFKVAFFLLVAHSMFDLNFSYMITLAVFGIILGIIEYKNEEKNEEKLNNKLIKNIMIVSYVLVSIIALYLSFKTICAYISSKMKIDTEYEENIEVLNEKIDFAYKRYFFDKTEFDNIKELVVLKENRILLLKNNLKDEDVLTVKSDIKEIYNLLNEIEENNKYNREAIYFICEKYYDNIENFAYVFLENDVNKANEIYKNKIFKLLEDLRCKYRINDSAIKKIDYLEKIYK